MAFLGGVFLLHVRLSFFHSQEGVEKMVETG